MSDPAETPPCARMRIARAHGPHDVDVPAPDGDGTVTARCPGVRAHPATMIGGAFRPAPEDAPTGPTGAE